FLAVLSPIELAGPHLPAVPTRRSSDLLRRAESQGGLLVLARHGVERGLAHGDDAGQYHDGQHDDGGKERVARGEVERLADERQEDRKSTRLNSSHVSISYAVFCLTHKT